MDDVVGVGVDRGMRTNQLHPNCDRGDLAALRAAQVAFAVAEYHLRSCSEDCVRRPALELAHNAEATWYQIAQIIEQTRTGGDGDGALNRGTAAPWLRPNHTGIAQGVSITPSASTEAW